MALSKEPSAYVGTEYDSCFSVTCWNLKFQMLAARYICPVFKTILFLCFQKNGIIQRITKFVGCKILQNENEADTES